MSVDLKHLIKLVKSSNLFSEEERKEWLQTMENMTDDQLEKLQDILKRGEDIDWEKEIPKYEAALKEAEAVVEKADEEFRSLSS